MRNWFRWNILFAMFEYETISSSNITPCTEEENIFLTVIWSHILFSYIKIFFSMGYEYWQLGLWHRCTNAKRSSICFWKLDIFRIVQWGRHYRYRNTIAIFWKVCNICALLYIYIDSLLVDQKINHNRTKLVNKFDWQGEHLNYPFGILM